MQTFFSADPQPLFEDLLLLPQAGASTGPTGRSPNSYALLLDGSSVLFDAPYRRLLSALQRLQDAGHPPVALVLSHYHVANQGDAYDALAEEFNLPILLHPADMVRASTVGVAFGDPRASETLAAAGLDIRPARPLAYAAPRSPRGCGALERGVAGRQGHKVVRVRAPHAPARPAPTRSLYSRLPCAPNRRLSQASRRRASGSSASGKSAMSSRLDAEKS